MARRSSEATSLMVDIFNLALPYFGLIFVGFACRKAKSLPQSGLAWMNFSLLDVSLPALLFAIRESYLRQVGVSPSRMAKRLSGPMAPRRCMPRARTGWSGRKSLSSERLAMSIANVRLKMSGRRARS